MTSKKTDCNFKKNDCCLCLSHSVLVIQSSNITTDHTQVSHQPPFKKIFSHVHPFKVFFSCWDWKLRFRVFRSVVFKPVVLFTRHSYIQTYAKCPLLIFIFFLFLFEHILRWRRQVWRLHFFFLFVRSSACLYLTSTASSDIHIFGLKCCTFFSEVYNRLV